MLERPLDLVDDHLANSHIIIVEPVKRGMDDRRSYSNTTVYYGIHERNECIPVDSGVTNLIHDRRSCVDFTLEVRRMWLNVSTQA